jgi:hypothetical protein
MAGHTGTVLVKSALTSQPIYHLTSLIAPRSPCIASRRLNGLSYGRPLIRVPVANVKVNWDTVCRPNNMGGMSILNTDFFDRALRLCWPGIEWKDPNKIWVGSGNPCNEMDMELFYAAATTICLGNGEKTHFLGDAMASW